MKYFKLALVLVMGMTVAGTAQIAVGIQIGYAQSVFEDHESKSGAIPLGVTVGTSCIPGLEVGGEFNTLLSPFVLDVKDLDIDFEPTQTIIGVYGKYFYPLPGVSPYGRLGVGYYTGSWDEGEYSGDYEGAVGFSVGVGATTMIGIYGEFVYHIVSRKGDWEGAESMGANNWGIHAGYRIEL
jgi:hypothetical protein